MSLRKAAILGVFAAACVLGVGMGIVFAEEAHRTGELNGAVVSVESFKAERDITRYKLTLTLEDGTEDVFIIGPANAKAYATVKALKAGDKVRLSWIIEGKGTQKWIKSIRKLAEETETR